jgi:hypothetical protein
LNLLKRDALEAGLDKANVWAGFVDWPRLSKLSDVWRPLESRIREVLPQIRSAEPEALERSRDVLVTVIQELETTMRPLNTEVICEMADKLKSLCGC